MLCNILYISHESTLGGATQSLLNMLKVVKKRNIMPTVIIPDNGMIEGHLVNMNIKYYIVPYVNGYGRIGTGSQEKDNEIFLDNYQAALQILDIIQREEIDLVHINSSVTNVGAIAALLADIPYVWHLREFLEEDFRKEFWDKGFKRQLLGGASEIITISHAVSEAYNKKYDIDSVCIYNGLDIENYKDDLMELSEDALQRFIIIGSIMPGKGQFEAIKAMELLLDEGYKNIHLALIGQGAEYFRWIVKQYISKKNLESYIDIIPFQKNLRAYRKQCQYALTTSRMEALGRSTIEAMLAGNIVIGANTGGTKEIIGENETRGYLYEQGNYVNLAAVMKRVMAEGAEKKKKCREEAQRYAEETFSSETYADRICELYEKVIRSYSKQEADGKRDFVEELNKRYENLREMSTIKQFKGSDLKVFLTKWSNLTGQNIRLGDILIKNDYNKVAIYGMGNLGCKLYEDLKLSKVEIPYVIDKNPEYLEEILVVKRPDDIPTGIDVVVVTVLQEEDEIVRRYQEQYGCCALGITRLIDMALEQNDNLMRKYI